MLIEEKLAIGLVALRIITSEDASELVRQLNDADFGVTSVAARGMSGRVRLLFSIIRRKQVDRALAIVRRTNPRAFISISDVRTANEGFIPGRRPGSRFVELLRRQRRNK